MGPLPSLAWVAGCLLLQALAASAVGSGSTYLPPGRKNIFGVGLVDQGNTKEIDYVQGLAGDGGWILLIFAGINNQSTQPHSDWAPSLRYAYSKNLNVVVRMAPPWGSSYYRSESNDAAHRNYTTLANAYKTIVQQLPLPPNGGKLWFQIENEPDLCYEWFCRTPGAPLGYQEMAAEFAFFYSYVYDALKSLNKPQIQIAPAPLAPGGAIQCGCCGSQNCPKDKGGITGLTYMKAMLKAFPTIYSKMDFLATHSYPAAKIGSNFFVPFSRAKVGLTYYVEELKLVGRDVPVLITETGWGTHAPGGPPGGCTEQQKAEWTVDAYTQIWLNDTRVMGVMPFMLMGYNFGDKQGFEYVKENGNIAPVYHSVAKARCKFHFGPC